MQSLQSTRELFACLHETCTPHLTRVHTSWNNIRLCKPQGSMRCWHLEVVHTVHCVVAVCVKEKKKKKLRRQKKLSLHKLRKRRRIGSKELQVPSTTKQEKDRLVRIWRVARSTWLQNLPVRIPPTPRKIMCNGTAFPLHGIGGCVLPIYYDFPMSVLTKPASQGPLL
eukprot:1143824-Pelagomonas_calceolata.AAC.1